MMRFGQKWIITFELTILLALLGGYHLPWRKKRFGCRLPPAERVVLTIRWVGGGSPIPFHPGAIRYCKEKGVKGL